jgi:alkylation response protein AidB-like acyl-CoA dehydrogenase
VLAREEKIDRTTAPDYVARVQALVPAIEAAADRIEAERRIVPDVVAALHGAGIFHMLLPPSLGGGGADIVAFNEVIQTIAAADASTAWCVGQQVASTQAAGYLDPKVASEIFGPPHGAVAWGPPAGAKATATDGGYKVTGRWRFASGSGHCPWIGGHSAVIERDGKPRLDDKGRPVMRTMLFRKEQAKWTDIWHTVGLRGTGSNQYEVNDLFVPDAYTTWRDEQADRTNDGALYDIPLLTLYGIGFSGVGLGLARGSLDAFMALANNKTGRAGRGVMRDNPVIQSDVAKVAGGLHAARAFLREMLEEIWQAVNKDGATLDQRARLRLAITGALDQSVRTVDFAYTAAATSAIFTGSPFERRFRDMHTVTAQGQAHMSNFESAGQALFGIEPMQRL